MLDITNYFVGYELNETKLQKFGFNHGEISIRLNEELTANIYIKGNSINLEIIDLNFNDEIMTYENIPSIKILYLNLIDKIKDSCALKLNYHSEQANFIDHYIENKYKVNAEFLWNEYPDFGIYRNAANQKWFGLIMNVDYQKVNKSKKGEVEIMNLKLTNLDELLKVEGIYPAYHMNKKYWVSIVLDHTLNDEAICSLIDQSYEIVNKKETKK